MMNEKTMELETTVDGKRARDFTPKRIVSVALMLVSIAACAITFQRLGETRELLEKVEASQQEAAKAKSIADCGHVTTINGKVQEDCVPGRIFEQQLTELPPADECFAELAKAHPGAGWATCEWKGDDGWVGNLNPDHSAPGYWINL